jgi:hypothetical protein
MSDILNIYLQCSRFYLRTQCVAYAKGVAPGNQMQVV